MAAQPLLAKELTCQGRNMYVNVSQWADMASTKYLPFLQLGEHSKSSTGGPFVVFINCGAPLEADLQTSELRKSSNSMEFTSYTGLQACKHEF